MYKRIFDIENQLDEAMFLFGGRQVGKSTLLKERFKAAIYYDLLKSDLRRRLRRNPELFRNALMKEPEGTLVIVDEIQKIPDLLDEVHLKKEGANTLGGRATKRTLFPLVWPEIPDFDIDRAVQNGMIPPHYAVKDATDRLEAYVDLYLREEIQEEALVQDIDDFARFMEVAAISDGEMINYENIASDCGVSAKTVKSYFRILYDTLIGYEIPAYTKVIKRRVSQAPKFYYFDVGLANYLMGRNSLKRGTDDFGHAFEHYIVQEILAYRGYFRRREEISLLEGLVHTGEADGLGLEVDLVIGDASVAIEIKSSEEVMNRHKTGLNAFKDEHPDCRAILVSLDPITRPSSGMELIYVNDFLKMLWNGEIF